MSTTVTGILRDSSGQLWTNAPIQVIFQPNQSTSGPYIWSGGNFNGMPPIIKTDASGSFSIILPANSEIVPSGSYWQFIIGPSATLPAIVFNLTLITGSLDISALFAIKAAPGITQSLFVPRAYSDTEVIVPPNSGQLYYDVTNKALKYYENGIWNALATGGGAPVMVYPSAGIGVSTGTAWTTSIDPATVPRLNVVNTFTQSQIVGGIVDNGNLVVVGNSQLTGGLNVIGTPTQQQNSLKISFPPSGIGTIDAVGATPAVKGQLRLRVSNSDASSIIDALDIDTIGNVTLNGNVTTTGSATFNGFINTFGSAVRIGNSSGSRTPWQSGTANINSNGSSIAINPVNGPFATYFNYDQGTGGVQFCNGAQAIVASIDAAGNAVFNGGVQAKLGGAFSGNGAIVPGSLRLVQVGDNVYLDAVGTAGPRGMLNFRNSASDGSALLTSLILDGSGNATFNGTVTASTGFFTDCHSPRLVSQGPGQGASYWKQDTNLNDVFWIEELFGGTTQRCRVMNNAGTADFTWLSVSHPAGNYAVDQIHLETNAGTITLNGNVQALGGIALSGAQNYQIIRMTQTDSPADNRVWAEDFAVNTLRFRVVNDANSADYTWLSATRAGAFINNVQIVSGGTIFLSGATSVFGDFAVSGAKTFKITHPLDETKDLLHACLEGPENGVFYRGEASTDNGGQVLLFLPDYFEALTYIEDRSVQLTVIDDGSLNFPLLKSTAVEAGSFVVYSSISNTKFYWEVKAVRKIGVSRLEVEPKKEVKSKGE